MIYAKLESIPKLHRNPSCSF